MFLVEPKAHHRSDFPTRIFGAARSPSLLAWQTRTILGKSEHSAGVVLFEMVSEFAAVIGFSGATRRIRTDDLLITNCIG
jgi:hypothetical protein